jgi:hypothetical protein
MINQSKIRWALDNFKPFKSAGTDGIVPVLFQQEAEHVAPHLHRIFRACMAYGFIPMAWRQVKVTVIPKPGKSDYTEANLIYSVPCIYINSLPLCSDQTNSAIMHYY